MSKTSSTIAVKDVVHKLQLCLLEGIKSECHLLVAGSLLSKADYHDVVIERSITKMCGYPLCPNSLPSPSSSSNKGRYHICLKDHKVYDLVETHMYCSTKCVVDSRAFTESLQHQRSLALDTAKLEKVVNLFEGLGENGDLRMGNLSIKEKEDASVGGGIVSMEELIGPSNAIEGYVPQHDRSSKSRTGSKLKDSKLKREEKSIFDEMNFMSTIISQENGYSISKEPSGQTKKIAGAISKDSRKKMNHKGTNDEVTTSQNVPETNLNEYNNEESEVVMNHNKPRILDVPSQSMVDVNVTESIKAPICNKEAQPSCSGLKSSLKSSSGAFRTNHSVAWADDGARNQTFNGIENDKDTSKGFGMTDKSIDDDDDDNVFRFASAEACAADAVASGESDAVSEAGLVILPPPLDDNEVISTDPEPAARLKWPKRTGIVESDFLNSGDSWFDSPPEEFVVDLSPFATMFMSLFAWISSSTLAYLYGRDHEEYASTNGREYPRNKIVLTDGRSSEIKQTLAGCLSRSLPGLVHDLRLPTPVSTIEYGMGCLLDTTSFLDPLPSLRMKQWQVFVLLFVEALSVCRIPAIAPPHLTNRRKVFDDAQISTEEYEVLKDLMLLPLGRVSQFATQSGG